MPRQLRDQEPGSFHVTTRGNNGRDVYETVDDRRVFIALLGRIAGDLEWELLTWCLMGNHFHLVLETQHANLSAGMRRLNGLYAQWFNAWHDRRDHVFGRRFWSKRIESEAQLRTPPRTSSTTPDARGSAPIRGIGGGSAARSSPRRGSRGTPFGSSRPIGRP